MESFSYDNRVVAFVDVLGFSDLVEKSANNQTEKDKIGEIIGADKLFSNFVNVFLAEMASGAVFSDSFVLSMAPQNVYFMVREVGHICRHLLQLGISCRGAITIGPFYHHGHIMVGPALVKAVRLEKSVAIYPRIILDDLSFAAWEDEFELSSAHSGGKSLVKRDHDGRHFIDIFHPEWFDCRFLPLAEFGICANAFPPNHNEFISAASVNIKRNLEIFKAQPKTHAKYSWLYSECEAHL